MEDTSHIFEMEETFESEGVFVNAIRETPAHMDSYMTVMDFPKFFEAWDKVKEKFTREQWISACDYWLMQNYLSPMAGLLARMVKRKLEVN